MSSLALVFISLSDRMQPVRDASLVSLLISPFWLKKPYLVKPSKHGRLEAQWDWAFVPNASLTSSLVQCQQELWVSAAGGGVCSEERWARQWFALLRLIPVLLSSPGCTAAAGARCPA